MAAERCESCRFFQKPPMIGDTVVGFSRCKRRSPQITQEHMDSPKTEWPKVDASDWCGDYQWVGEYALDDEPMPLPRIVEQ